MDGDALALGKKLDGAAGEADLDLGAGEAVGHAVEVLLDFDVIINADAADAPLRKNVRPCCSNSSARRVGFSVAAWHAEGWERDCRGRESFAASLHQRAIREKVPSLPQENTDLLANAKVQSAVGVLPLVHDSLPQENTEASVATNAQSATAVRPMARDSLQQENTEPPDAANVQSATVVPPMVHDNLAQDRKPPLRAAETSPVPAQDPQLSQSVASPLVLDANEIAALVKRGKEFATHGDLISARLLLRRAAEAGSAEAALALGETLDPLVFQHLGVIGIALDAASARK